MDRGKSFPSRLMYPLIFFFLVNVLTVSEAKNVTAQNINREDFPANFLFGVATVAYQNEGATKEGGRGKTTWDTFAEKYRSFIKGNATADLACDSYHRYKDDVKLVKEMGMNAYRISIAWTRILPGGHLSKGVNKEGVQYYNNLINEILSNGIQPFVTLWHFDVPQVLEDEYNSFLSPKFVDDYKDLVDVCFKEFGDRVKHWITFNEPWTLVWGGYAKGLMPPKRCSDRTMCSIGDSGTEPYIVGHNLLLAHAAAVNLYKEKYQASQKGIIGITLNTDWMVPASNKTEDSIAVRRGLDFNLGWFLDPLTHGHYPETMVNILKDRLPAFTPEELKKIKGSYDFIGLNYYSTCTIANNPNATKKSYLEDPQVTQGDKQNGVVVGEQAGIFWQQVYPQGFREILNFVKSQYQSPVIYITENGYSTNTTTESFKEAIADAKRVDFYSQHLYQLQQAIKDGVDVRGYFAWTLMDNFEWASGYDIAFGLHHVDRKNGLKVYPKDSSKWFKNFLQYSIKVNVEL